MATGDGWTSQLLTGLAEHLADASIGTWQETGAYAAGVTGICIRAVPQTPDRTITLATYPIGSNLPGLADHLVGVQIRVRGGTDPRECEDLADAIYTELDGLAGARWSGIPIVQVTRQSYSSLGTDANGLWERSENYYVQAMRPTSNNTD